MVSSSADLQRGSKSVYSQDKSLTKGKQVQMICNGNGLDRKSRKSSALWQLKYWLSLHWAVKKDLRAATLGA